jgi:hypothetical protein
MKGGYPVKKTTGLVLILAGFLLAAQSAGAFDAGSWFTGKVAALDNAFAPSTMRVRSSSGHHGSSALQRTMKQFKEQGHSKKKHSRR